MCSACVGKEENLVDQHVKFDDEKVEVIEIPNVNFSPGPRVATNVPTYTSYRKVKLVNKKRRISGWFSYLIARYSAISMARGVGFTHDVQGGPPLPKWEGVSRNTSDGIVPKIPLLWYHNAGFTPITIPSAYQTRACVAPGEVNLKRFRRNQFLI